MRSSHLRRSVFAPYVPRGRRLNAAGACAQSARPMVKEETTDSLMQSMQRLAFDDPVITAGLECLSSDGPRARCSGRAKECAFWAEGMGNERGLSLRRIS